MADPGRPPGKPSRRLAIAALTLAVAAVGLDACGADEVSEADFVPVAKPQDDASGPAGRPGLDATVADGAAGDDAAGDDAAGDDAVGDTLNDAVGNDAAGDDAAGDDADATPAPDTPPLDAPQADIGCAAACEISLSLPPGGCLQAECDAGVCKGVPKKNDAPCDDGDPCTSGDGCGEGVCKPGKPKPCDDGLPCTADGCDAKTGQCQHKAAAEGATCGGAGKCAGGYCVKLAAQGRKMLHVPAGPFWMGCNAAKDSACSKSSDENPPHEVTLAAFWIDMYEVTVADYSKCLAAGKCDAPKTGSSCNWGVSGREQHPVNCVDWSQATAYCQWLGSGYDLPTEARWEKAARGGCGQNGGAPGCKDGMRTYPWGEATPTCDLAVLDSGGNGCGQGSTWPVGSKPKGVSPFGAHDMAGNVWEWVRDSYDSAWYGKSPKSEPMNGQIGTGRVIRGGSWYYTATFLRSSDRDSFNPSYTSFVLGFRCAR